MKSEKEAEVAQPTPDVFPVFECCSMIRNRVRSVLVVQTGVRRVGDEKAKRRANGESRLA